jgi:hypothetical protein
MNNNNNDNLFSASLESIDSSKRVDKYQRFKNDFQRECNATLNNAQEWIKAELPIVTDYIDAAAVKDELKLSKTSDRRKHLLSSLLFEKSLRESIENNHASKAAVMAIHMCNHMWQAKVELYGSLPTAVALGSSIPTSPDNSAIDTHSDTSAKILTTLIEKSEKLQQDSQIQSQIKSNIKTKSESNNASKNNTFNSKQNTSNPIENKSTNTSRKKNLWAEEAEKEKQQKLSSLTKNNKSKKKSSGVFSKVKSRFLLKKRKKANRTLINKNDNQAAENSPEDSLFDNPNNSAIIVSPGFSESNDDFLIRARPKFSDNPNESGITVHKVLKEYEHEKQALGSNTIIMKLASSAGKQSGVKSSTPEQCQQAVNILTQQFPSYDKVAIRNMAATKVGVSFQYIENLNILPEQM